MHHVTQAPTCVVEIEKIFIQKAIELLLVLNHHDRDFYVELMVQFLDGDKDVRCVHCFSLARLKKLNLLQSQVTPYTQFRNTAQIPTEQTPEGQFSTSRA